MWSIDAESAVVGPGVGSAPLSEPPVLPATGPALHAMRKTQKDKTNAFFIPRSKSNARSTARGLDLLAPRGGSMHAMSRFGRALRQTGLAVLGAICANIGCGAPSGGDAEDRSDDAIGTARPAVDVPFDSDGAATALPHVVVGSRSSQADLSASFSAHYDGT